MSGPVEIVASYTYSDGELRFSDFSFPNCDDCFGYEVAFGFAPAALGAAGMIRPPACPTHRTPGTIRTPTPLNTDGHNANAPSSTHRADRRRPRRLPAAGPDGAGGRGI